MKINWRKIEKNVRKLVEVLHEELGWFNKEELENTPTRITNFFKEWFENGQYNKFTTFSNGNGDYGSKYKFDQLVILKNITLHSLCSHHMLPFFGEAYIAYLPGEKVIGVSKLARIVKKYASKPQIQEQLTQEIAEELFKILKPKFLIVVIKAKHTCMIIRGVKEHDSEMITSAIKYDENDERIKQNWQMIKEEALKLFGF